MCQNYKSWLALVQYFAIIRQVAFCIVLLDHDVKFACERILNAGEIFCEDMDMSLMSPFSDS